MSLLKTQMISFKEKIEVVFNPRNIDGDCDKIAFLLQPYGVQIKEMLKKGECHEAFTLFYEILDSLSRHFVEDYVCKDMMDAIIDKIKEGIVTDSEFQYLKSSMGKIAKMEAYENYGTPFAVSDWVAFCRKYSSGV